MHIEIHIPRPGTMLLFVAAATGWGLYMTTSGQQLPQATVIAAPVQVTSSAPSVAPTPAQEPAAGMQNTVAQINTAAPVDVAIAMPPQENAEEDNGLSQPEMRMKWARSEQDFLAQRDAIVRAQLADLQKERDALGPNIDPALEEQFRNSVRLLTSLVQDQKKAEEFLLTSYRQEWEAEERSMAIGVGAPTAAKVQVLWPVAPSLGISAYFMDPTYKERFKVDHYAIDIPTHQGTVVLAAADGIVKDVVDHGLGYNYVTIDHGGYSTVYGHLSQFSVTPGEHIRIGEVIGLSGGMPGLPGGGSSTGPHLHFGLYLKGIPVNPLKYLPKWQG